MRIVHIALGGCLSGPPIPYGVTEDTGGHIAYVLGAAMAQARRPDTHVTIVTRGFDEPRLGDRYAAPVERVSPRCTIRRLRSAVPGYVCKEALEAEVPQLTEAFLDLLEREGAPDVIHAHFADAACLAEAAKARFGTPWLLSCHSLASEKRGAWTVPGPALCSRIAHEGRALALADAVIASSRDEAERQIAVCHPPAEGRVHRVPPGIGHSPDASPERARALIAPFLRSPDRPVILALSRAIAKKNLVALVEAYAGAPDLREAANLVIVAGLRDGLTGGTSEQDEVISALFDAVDRNDLWGRVALPRRHMPEDVPSFYALAAQGGVFCNPAHHEPFGLTLIEAARGGAPIVATRDGGPADIVETIGYGALVDPTDLNDIAAGLRRMLVDPGRSRKLATARARASRVYDWDLYAERSLEICAELARPAPVGPRAGTRDLIACDIDGTLTGNTASAREFAAWAEARRPDQVFMVATGRSVSDARHVLAEWRLPVPDTLVTSVGTEIWRRGHGNRYLLCEDFAKRIGTDWARDAILDVLAPFTMQSRHEQRRWKLGYLGTETDAERMRASLAEEGLSARIVASHGRFVDVMPANAGKAEAITFEAKRLNLRPENCVVAGDSGNDADMLAAFSRAILPRNALPELDTLTGGYRAAQPFAAGVLEGFGHYGLLPVSTMAAE
ncbi:HAD-IIB family hydrolase [Palleronia sp. LCG004]|uniref:HAD-IIB family hydrolase n=1 Tax=Palleronia sp. LCG004 TaxID=3079304 RepID=UPI0029433DF9|nr:HAD-IIB family hydrolase [Palleronia sp. LCG004]WOI56245.1 HAD-IIB family hydrolase [Palleronia sp. LCG004]